MVRYDQICPEGNRLVEHGFRYIDAQQNSADFAFGVADIQSAVVEIFLKR